ncbi:MAG: enoyl-CoA hydratase/isomerase family protein [Gemmatimonadales bacterium]|nr:MAG: enoyl-CoA hydratase/isomerase family protein [Gemmatimonadales bacterium]
MSLAAVLDRGVLTLTLNRPDKRNALNAAMIGALRGELERAALDSSVRVVAIRGAGKDFCAGADLDELLASATRNPAENEADARRLGEIFVAMRGLPKPVVGIVHGRALAGGAGLATACDILLMAGSAQLGYPEIQRGFVPAMVMTMLRRMVGERLAFDLVATGRLVTAEQAVQMGLASRVVPDADLDAAGEALLAQLASTSASALALTKRLLYQLDGVSFAGGIALGARVNAVARAHPDFRDAIAAFLGK